MAMLASMSIETWEWFAWENAIQSKYEFIVGQDSHVLVRDIIQTTLIHYKLL